MGLSPYERWMVQSNLATVRTADVTLAEQVARLEANGYARVAAAVAASEVA
jgi:hypothetical protein